MKESIAQAFILNLILFFFVILVLLLFGSINYSKAYKAKNRIINIIEKHGGYPEKGEKDDYNDVEGEINENLAKAGYQTITTAEAKDRCKKIDNNAITPTVTGGRRYDYCVIKHSGTVGDYYQVIAFMRFEVPVIGGILDFKVKGETKTLYNNIDG